MVAMWPWRGEDTSPASFEKSLSTLSAKISQSQIQLDATRQSARRFKALWTLYTSFAYLLYGVVLALVVGWQSWNAYEYGILGASPIIIYLVRAAIASYYDYRIQAVTHRLEEQQLARSKTIDKLKAATKYNSTQQLLEKYGESPSLAESKVAAKPESKPVRVPQRIHMVPPPTANIVRSDPTQSQSPPSVREDRVSHQASRKDIPSSPVMPPEFAPNAFTATPQYEDKDVNGRWYDRVLDLLLGDDETSPKNRMVLICKHCRLVNGQAPAGIKSLTDLGRWRCSACGGWNGELDESTKLVAELKRNTVGEGMAQPETDEGVTITRRQGQLKSDGSASSDEQ